MRSLILSFVSLLALAGPARADLSYTFASIEGFFAASFVDVSIAGNSFSFDQGGVKAEGSLEVHKYIHLVAEYSWSQTVSDERILGTTNFDESVEFIQIGGGLHHRLLGDRSSVFFDLQGILGKSEYEFDGLGIQFDEEEWGFLFRAGIRWMPPWEWSRDQLEIYATMRASNQNLIENLIAFDVGGRWDINDWVSLNVAVLAGTDSFVGVTGGLRFYWWSLLNKMRGKDPDENLPWIKDAMTGPGGYSSAAVVK